MNRRAVIVFGYRPTDTCSWKTAQPITCRPNPARRLPSYLSYTHSSLAHLDALQILCVDRDMFVCKVTTGIKTHRGGVDDNTTSKKRNSLVLLSLYVCHLTSNEVEIRRLSLYYLRDYDSLPNLCTTSVVSYCSAAGANPI